MKILRSLGLLITMILFPVLQLHAQIKSIERVSVSSAGVEGNGDSDGAALNGDGTKIAFRSNANNLSPRDLGNHIDVFLHATSDSSTIRVSEYKSSGGDADSGVCSVNSRPIIFSSNGEFLAFSTDATNIAPPDSNSARDAVSYQISNDSLTLTSVQSTSFQSGAASEAGGISDDGKAASFINLGKDFISNDPNSGSDVFVRYQDSFVSTLQSKSTQSAGANLLTGSDVSFDPVMDGSGTQVCFASAASDLVNSDTNGVNDIFLATSVGTGVSQTLTLKRVSVSTAGQQADRSSSQPWISSDGRWIVFASDATNLVNTDTNGKRDIFLYDNQNATTELISMNRSAGPANGDSSLPSVSSDGRYVAFLSGATNLVSGDTNGVSDVFVRDRLTAKTFRVNLSLTGSQTSLPTTDAQISGDGKWVAFSTADSNLVSSDTNNAKDVFLVQFVPVITPDTPLTDPPTASVDAATKITTLNFPKFPAGSLSKINSTGFALGAAQSLPAKKISVDFRYDVQIKGNSGAAAGYIRRIVTKRNQLSIKNLKSGTYTTHYRVAFFKVVTRSHRPTVKRSAGKTSLSPDAGFTIP